MRTTIDMPDELFSRAKAATQARRVTFRALLIDALENSLRVKPKRFVLREASAGYKASGKNAVSSRAVNRALDEIREPRGAP